MTLESEVAEVMVRLTVLRREAGEVNPRASEWLGCALDDVEDAWRALVIPNPVV